MPPWSKLGSKLMSAVQRQTRCRLRPSSCVRRRHYASLALAPLQAPAATCMVGSSFTSEAPICVLGEWATTCCVGVDERGQKPPYELQGSIRCSAAACCHRVACEASENATIYSICSTKGMYAAVH
jgi:hypothetical protein